MIEINCYWCGNEVTKPYGLVCTEDDIKTTFCKNCKKETALTDKITKKIEDFLIKQKEISDLLDFLQSKKWYCRNCGRDVLGNRLFRYNKSKSRTLTLGSKCKRCGQKNVTVVDYKPLIKWFKSSGKSKRSNKNYVLEG